MFFKFTDVVGVEKAIPREDVKIITSYNGVVQITYWFEPSKGYVTDKAKESFSVLVKRINTF